MKNLSEKSKMVVGYLLYKGISEIIIEFTNNGKYNFLNTNLEISELKEIVQYYSENHIISADHLNNAMDVLEKYIAQNNAGK